MGGYYERFSMPAVAGRYEEAVVAALEGRG
jgi:hypothetical protein